MQVDFNVRFAEKLVDHFGLVEGDAGGNDRTNYWLPPDSPPPKATLPEDAPAWALAVVEGRALRRGAVPRL